MRSACNTAAGVPSATISVHDRDTVAEHRGVVVVQPRPSVSLADKIEQPDLVSDVEMIGRLVQQQYPWFLRQSAGWRAVAAAPRPKARASSGRPDAPYRHIGQRLINDCIIFR